MLVLKCKIYLQSYNYYITTFIWLSILSNYILQRIR